MTLDDFKQTLSAGEPPRLSRALTALWHDARGNWDAAHGVAQDISTPDGAWVHAYLHRKEGDLTNARYWYQRAGQDPQIGPLDSERDHIIERLLNDWER
jgi:hypothetical protein